VNTLQPNPDWAKLPLLERREWKRVHFGEVVENFSETERNPAEGGIERFIGLEHLEPGSLHVRAWGDVADGTTFRRRCRPGQVLFGKRRAYQRKVAVAEFDAVVSGDIYVLAPKNGRLLPGLLPFLCMSERFFQHAVGTSAGSLSPRTNWSSLASFEFDLPPLDQQSRIVEILWAVDEVGTRLSKVSEDECAAHKTFQNNAVDAYLEKGKTGGIPIRRMSDILDKPICNGIFKKREDFGKGTLLINVTDVYGSFRLNPAEVERVDANQKEIMTFSALPGDVIFNRSSLVLAGIGHACLVPDWSEPMVFECHLMRARPNRDIPFLPIRLDRRDPRHNASQFGKDMGLPDFFAGVDRTIGGYEGLSAAQQRLPNNETRDKFAAEYIVLGTIWEALSPDLCLSPYENDYRWLTQVYESVKPPSGNGKLLWHALGAKTVDLINQNVHVDSVRDDIETLVLDAQVLEEILADADPAKKGREIEIMLVARLRRHLGHSKFVALGERLEKVKERHEQGFLTSLEFLKQILEIAKEVLEAEKETDPEEERDRAKEALTELFTEAKSQNTHIIVERIVADIDEIVKKVRFPDWQHTSQGERLVQKELRKALLKYKLHTDQELFDRAYAYIRQYY